MDLTFRRLIEDDVQNVVEFAIVGMRPHLFKHAVFRRDKVEAVVRAVIGNDTWFNLAAFEGSRPVAIVAAIVQDMTWFERCEAHVVICRSERPGAGVRLIRAFMDWCKADPRIRQISFALEPDADGRQLDMLRRRFGFQASQTVALWAKE